MSNEWLVVWVSGFTGTGSGFTSGEASDRHNSQLMVPTSTNTTTTALFLPDSRARMRDGVQEDEEKKNKREE